MRTWRSTRRALAATHARQRLDRGPGFSGDLRNFPVLGLDIGLGVHVSVDLAEFRARYFAVGGARPILVKNIEENELLDAANSGTSGHVSILGILVDVPQTSTNWRRRSETVLLAIARDQHLTGSLLHAFSASPNRLAAERPRCAPRRPTELGLVGDGRRDAGSEPAAGGSARRNSGL